MSDNTTGVSVTVPFSTPQASPVIVPVNLGLSDVQEIVCVTPPGPAGNAGFAIYMGGTIAYPVGPIPWFVFDDYTYVQEVSSRPKTGQWAIYAYNNDVFQHIFTFYFKWNNIVQSPILGFSPLVGV